MVSAISTTVLNAFDTFKGYFDLFKSTNLYIRIIRILA